MLDCPLLQITAWAARLYSLELADNLRPLGTAPRIRGAAFCFGVCRVAAYVSEIGSLANRLRESLHLVR